MKIIFLNWRDMTHPRRGGAEVLAEGLARRMAAEGHEVTFFSSRVSNQPSDEIRDGVRHVRRGGRLSVYPAAYAWLQQEKPSYDLLVDHINTVPFFTPLFQPRKSIALINQLALDVWRYEAPLLATVGITAERWYHRAYRTLPAITISQSSYDDLRRYGWRGRIEIIRMPFSGGSSALVAKTQQPSISFVGRLTPSKRPEHALRAFAVVRQNIPTATMRVIGEADNQRYFRRLQQLAASIGSVTLSGRLSDAERQRAVGETHILFTTSVREGWGLVVTEANAAGTPVIGYDVPGLRDSIKSTAGVLVPSGDTRALGQAAIALLEDPVRYERMRQSAMQDARQYNWETTLSDFKRALSVLAR